MVEKESLQDVFHRLHSLIQQHHNISDSGALMKRPDETLFSKVNDVIPTKKGRAIEEVIQDVQTIFSYRFSTGHPNFFAFIPSPASPISWMGDAISSVFNAYAGSSESGAGVHAIEVSLVAWIARLFGLPSTAGGQFVSGASLANLTALTVARDQRIDKNKLSKGMAYISEETHFCIPKALRIIGLSDEQIRTVPCDSQSRMQVNLLSQALLHDIKRGYKPFVVVATCGTTSTGAIDPLDDIADIAHHHNLWLHVDAAYGGSAVFSSTHRSLLNGLGRADSISWDPHKWLFQTLGCGVVVFRQKNAALKSFATTAHFLRDVEDETSRNPWNYGIELTRPARHMRLWFSLQVTGLDEIDRMVTRGFQTAKLVETELKKLPHWEILSASSMAIINFRFHPHGNLRPETIDTINTTVSKVLAIRNIAIIFTSQIKGVVALRMCTINPRTTDENIRSLIRALDDIAHNVNHQLSKEYASTPGGPQSLACRLKAVSKL